MQLYHDKPHSQGVENALKRARQMVDLKWAPVALLPAGQNHDYTPEGVKSHDIFLPAYRPQKGVGYSSVRIHEKYVGDNVLFETYLSALSNPRSIMYACPQFGLGRFMWNYYGTVCSSFVAYALNLPVRVPCKHWAEIPGVTQVDVTELENIRLGDVVLKYAFHITLITDIQRDVDGKVRLITVSESETPFCVAKEYTPEQFRGHWLANGYNVYRYAGIHDVPYTPDPFSPVEGDPPLECPAINTVIQPNFGNKANYMLGETVELDVLEDGWTQVEIAGPESVVLPVVNGKVEIVPKLPGYYTACCLRDGLQSETVQFRITDLSVSGDRAVCKKDGLPELTFQVVSGDRALGYIVHNMSHGWCAGGFLTDQEVSDGKVAITGKLAPGEYYAFVMAQGEYGRYRSPSVPFRVEE